MTIRFAAAQRVDVVSRCFVDGPPARAANDNLGEFAQDRLLRDALRHFAEHGLGAADLARANAEAAFFADDRAQYRRWLSICRTLDQRMAAAIAARSGRAWS